MRFNKKSEEKAVETVKIATKKATKATVKKVTKAALKKTVTKKPVKTDKKSVKVEKPVKTKETVKKTVTKKPVKTKTEKKPIIKKTVKTKTLPLKAPEVKKSDFVIEPNDLPTFIQEKVLRRAKRYFKGDNIRHRVITKTENSISFMFNRHGKKYSELPNGATITVTRVVE